jgi:hypothetical protein
MNRWTLYFIIYAIAWILNIFIAPIYSLFTAKGWPSWGYWLQTPDNLPQGDRQFMSKGAPFLGVGHKGVKARINRTWWLYRNPLVGFCVSVLGYAPSVLDESRASGDMRVGDKRKVAGLFIQKIYRNGSLVAFQYYYVKKWTENHCFRARIGWKLSSWPEPKMNKHFAFVCAITPWKAW